MLIVPILNLPEWKSQLLINYLVWESPSSLDSGPTSDLPQI